MKSCFSEVRMFLLSTSSPFNSCGHRIHHPCSTAATNQDIKGVAAVCPRLVDIKAFIIPDIPLLGKTLAMQAFLSKSSS